MLLQQGGTLYTLKSSITRASFCPIGRCVQTKYGQGVLIAYNRENEMHRVRLWSPRRQGTAMGYLNKSDLFREVVGCVGMTIQVMSSSSSSSSSGGEKVAERGLVTSYSSATDMFEVLLSNGNKIQIAAAAVDEAMLITCHEATILPTLESIMKTVQAKHVVIGDMIGLSSLNDIQANLKSRLEKGRESILERLAMSKEGTGSATLYQQTLQDLDEILLAMQQCFHNISSSITNGDRLQHHLDELRLLVDSLKAKIVNSSQKGFTISDLCRELSDSLFKPLTDFFSFSSFFQEKDKESILALSNTAGAQHLIKGGIENWERASKLLSTFTPTPSLTLTPVVSTPTNYFDIAGECLKFASNFANTSAPAVLESWVESVIEQSAFLKQLRADQLNNNNSSFSNLGKELGLEDAFTLSTFSPGEMIIANLIVKLIFYDEQISGYELQNCFLQNSPLAFTGSDALNSLSRIIPESLILAVGNNTQLSEVISPLATLVHQIGRKEITLESACMAAKQSLESAGFEDIAKQVILKSTEVVNALESIQGTDEFQQAFAHIKTMDLNILDGLHNLSIQAVDPNNNGSSSELSIVNIAEKAITNSEARSRFIDGVKSKVLDFLLSYIPTINLGGIDGVKDDIQFNISSLDLSGFRFQKEGVSVDVCTDLQADKDILSFTAVGITASFSSVLWKYSQNYFPHLRGEGNADANVQNATVRLVGFI